MAAIMLPEVAIVERFVAEQLEPAAIGNCDKQIDHETQLRCYAELEQAFSLYPLQSLRPFAQG